MTHMASLSWVSSACGSMATAAWMVYSGQPPLHSACESIEKWTNCMAGLCQGHAHMTSRWVLLLDLDKQSWSIHFQRKIKLATRILCISAVSTGLVLFLLWSAKTITAKCDSEAVCVCVVKCDQMLLWGQWQLLQMWLAQIKIKARLEDGWDLSNEGCTIYKSLGDLHLLTIYFRYL